MSRFLEVSVALLLAALVSAGGARAQDAAAGEKLFAKCKACHAVGEGAGNRVGPNLNDVLGRVAGGLESYKYSPAMTKAGEGGLVWREETLRQYLANPRGFVNGTKMTFAGIKKDSELTDIIAYLQTFSSGSADEGAAAVEGAPENETLLEAGAGSNDDRAADIAPTEQRRTSEGEGAVLGLGRAATDDEIAAWDIDVRPDGLGLPVGRGTVKKGEPIYEAQCASCHGDFGEAVGRWPVLAGGHGTLQDDRPEKTVGSYWPYLSTVYDYIRRAMPFGNARSLSDDEVYALAAYVLYLNDVVTDEDFELSSENFTSIRLPNEQNFIDDDRWSEPRYVDKSEPCMSNCLPGQAEIVMHATILDVTPADSGNAEAPAAGID